VADAPAVKKPKAVSISNWLNKPRQEKTDLVKQRTELWDAVNAFVTQQGGWVTSPPGTKRLRVEIQQDSALPARLLELGYSVRSAGIGTRITSGKFMPVEVIEIKLPG
jgi:hypothetical protein